ncbi:DgyrCDS766 [Dimorphilus gyrociliatus]|uniref:DgyrCDS766 n=1 Tax=Dimorphilus gyrociliatus TaxID=2664684 RepID=A0A7I8V7D6_9ANNE|nr:DgyrCDS766 [Dimorphilus gyrociliatus]
MFAGLAQGQAATLVVGLLTVPHYVAGAANWLFHNRHLRARDWEQHPDYFHWYLRDRRLTGSEYKPTGLEGLPTLSGKAE